MDPYSTAVTRDIQTAQYGHPLGPDDIRDPQNFDYPALIVPLLAPFAHYSWPAIRSGFLWLIVPAFAGACLLWLRLLRPGGSFGTSVLVVGLSLLAWPTVWGFRLQQPTMVLFILLAVAAFAVHRSWNWLAGICMAFALIKPQLSLPLILWLLVWALLHKRWRFPAGLAIAFSGLWLITEWLLPGWFPKWMGSMRAYTALTVPVSDMVAGKAGGLAITVMLGAWSAWLLWGMLGANSEAKTFGRAVALAIATSVFITPTDPALIYNQVLLVPAILLIVFVESQRPPSVLARMFTVLLLSWNYLAVAIAAVVEAFDPKNMIGYFLPFADQFLPLVVLVGLLVITEAEGWSKCGWRQLLKGRYRMAAARE
jgi:hypothetical protein